MTPIFHKSPLFLVALILVFPLAGCGKSTDVGEPGSAADSPLGAETQAAASSSPDEPSEAGFYCLPGIIPGGTSRTEIIQLMGEPVSTELAEDGSENLFYSSAVEEIPDTIVIRQNTVERASALNRDALVDLASIQQKYGEPEEITYSNFMQGTYTYLYPQKGFTVIAEPEGGQVFWMDCFISMSLENYLAGPGSALPLEDPHIR